MQPTAHTTSHTAAHEAHHEDLGFWRKYIFSTDHKVIGIQYGVTALIFLFFGLLLMLMMRWQIAHTGEPVPIVGRLLERLLNDPTGNYLNPAAKGIISNDLYNSLGAMHGTIMVFM